MTPEIYLSISSSPWDAKRAQPPAPVVPSDPTHSQAPHLYRFLLLGSGFAGMFLGTSAHGGTYVEGESFTLADIVLGAYARRWFGVEVPNRPAFDRVRAWYDGIAQRPAFQRYIALPLT